MRLARIAGLITATIVAVIDGGTVAMAAEDAAATRLRAQYEATLPRLRQNDFGRPMVLASSESPRELRGEIHALFDHPFDRVRAALDEPGEWCDVLLLPFNSKACQAASAGQVSLSIGKMNDAHAENAQTIVLAFRPLAATPQHFAVELSADSGPVGTSDYRIVVEAIPVDAKRTFLHFTYAYKYGTAAKLAMQAYLATAGRNKIGFTVTGSGTNGQPAHVDGMRGVIERNVMRYYLAIEAALHAAGLPAQSRKMQRLNHWFTATEAYPRQLREMSRAEYIALKTGQRGQSGEVLGTARGN
jgi:hypothetical protein